MAETSKEADKKSTEEEVKITEDNNGKKKSSKKASKKNELAEIKAELDESKDKYLRLYSEFENFRRRTAKEKLEMVGSANEGLIQQLLPVLDDFERADKSITEDSEISAIKEGLDLIYNKFKNVLEQKGVKKVAAEKGADFDLEKHEAITQIPAPEESLKGKIVDVIENGYELNDKVIRFAKVVTGA